MLSLSPVKWTLILVSVAAGVLLLAAACGGDDDDGNGSSGTATATATEAGGEATPFSEIEPQPVPPQEIKAEVTEAVNGVIQTTVNDSEYVLNNLKAPLNETTTIEIVNEGAAIHNFRIAGADGEWTTDDDVVSDPELIRSGESAVVTFTPTLAGTYTFRCEIHPTTEGGVIVVG